MSAFYNEREPYAAQWLRNLIAAGHIADGVVDERDIRDIEPRELSGFTQCHFFAGIGVWSRALRQAGWPDERPIWTGSCPCQPFSAAGRGDGFADERHLWPAFHWLIDQCRPPAVIGEQVASRDGLAWLDLVSADMEGTGYAFGASDLCAAGFGGAHIRQRFYFVGLANAASGGQQHEPSAGPSSLLAAPAGDAGRGSESSGYGTGADRLADADGGDASDGGIQRSGIDGLEPENSGADGGRDQGPRPDGPHRLADADIDAQRPGRGSERERGEGHEAGPDAGGRSLDGTRWPRPPMLGRHAADWLLCRDGRWRPVEPGTFPLAHGIAARVGRLRAYGNALDADTAEGFVRAVIEAIAQPPAPATNLLDLML